MSVPLPSDEEITRVLATDVMGWIVPAGCSDWYTKNKIKGKFGMTRERRASFGWSPLTSIADAFMVVEKMRERGWGGQIDIMDGGYDCQFQRRPPSGEFDEICKGHTSPARAIGLAAYAAIKGTKK